MKKIIALIRVVIVCCVFSNCFCLADPLDDETLKLIDIITKGHEENRNKIKDMEMSMSITKKRFKGEEITRDRVTDSTYYRLGQKERVDSIRTKSTEENDINMTNTLIQVLADGKFLDHLEGTALCAVSPARSAMKMPIRMLKNDIFTPSFSDHFDEISFYIERFDPAKESVTVEKIVQNGNTLFKIVYDTDRGGKGFRTFTINPSFGYEVINTTDDVYRRDGTLYISKTAEYKVEEIGEEIWYPVEVTVDTKQNNSNGVKINTRETLKVSSYEINTGKIDESMFTFEGMGVPAGTPIADLTFDPPLEYHFKAAPFSEVDLDALLDESTYPKLKNDGVETPDKTFQTKDIKKAADQTGKLPDDISKKSGSNKVTDYRSKAVLLKTIIAVILVFIAAFVLGCIYRNRLTNKKQARIKSCKSKEREEI